MRFTRAFRHLSAYLRLVLISLGFVGVAAGAAMGQVSPLGTHHPTVGPGAGVTSPLSPTGGYGASVRLDLPSPRGGLPVPLSIVYNGSTRAGAAGAGWDVPIWYVHRSASAFQRKPEATADGSYRAEERIYVSLGGAPQLMVPHGNVYVPFMGSEYSELRQIGDSWVLRTLDNVEYEFSLSSSDFWVLRQIRDATGTDRVTLTYDTATGCPGPRELNLGSVAYGHSASGIPLYEIKLDYRRWDADACFGFDTGRVSVGSTGFLRHRVLESIEIKARNNLDPTAAPKRVRLYDLIYGVEQDTYKPLLTQVWAFGEEGVPTVVAPVGIYGYGSVSRPPDAQSGGKRIVEFGAWEVVPRPSEVTSSNEYRNDLATSDVHRTTEHGAGLYDWVHAVVETTRARHLLRDFTGDGVADLLVYRSDIWGGTWVLYPGRLATHGVGFVAGSETTWSGSAGPQEIHVQSTFRFSEATANGEGAPISFGVDPGRFAREALITTETWSQFVDWNGDGRLDVVDAKDGQGPNHWKVWLNEPAPNAALQWRPIQVDITPIRAALAARGLRRDDWSEILPGLNWSDRLPLDRTKSWPRSESYECTMRSCDANGCTEAGPCEAPDYTPDYTRVLGTDSITEWQLADVNEDGFLDFAANTTPARYCQKDVVEGNAPDCSSDPFDATVEHFCATRSQEWLMRTDAVECNNPSQEEGSADFFPNRIGPFVGHVESPFAGLPVPLGDVVAHWTTGSNTSLIDWTSAITADAGFSWSASALDDRFGHGELTSNTSQYFGPEVSSAFATNRHTSCAGPNSGSNNFASHQTLGEADLNGDGLADRIDLTSSSVVRFNTGAGYGPSRALRWPTDAFAISESTGFCDDDAHTRAGLTDLDGDGKPELLRAKNGVLYMSRLLPGDGADNLHAAGKLMQIGNLRGGLLRIIYGNAKREINTVHAVPFPEIVVRQTYAFTADGSGPNMAPTHYAFGEARLEYDPIAGGWRFPGYRRTATIAGGVLGQTTISGVLAVSESNPAGGPGATYVQHIAAHFPETQRFYEGTFNVNALDPYLNQSVSGGVAGNTTRPFAQIVEPQTIVDEREHLECGDLDPATWLPFGYGRCRSAGIVYAASSETWEGLAAPPALTNTYVGSSVELVDMFGRPRRVHNKGDLRRTDDDVCTEIQYAVTPGGSAFPSVPSRIEVDDCGYGSVDEGAPPGTPEVLAASRFEYDTLPQGEAIIGRLSRRFVERYDDTGYRDSHEIESLTYDNLGQVREVRSSRGLGSPATTTSTLSRDAFGMSITQVVDAASDVAVPLVRTTSQSTWPSMGASSTNPNGIIHRVERDGLGRVTHERITGALGVKATVRRITYAADGRSVTTDVFPGTTTPGQEDAATDRLRSTVYLDALLRPRFTQSLLGTDYAGSTMVSGYVEYDTFGRVVFAAHPFESSAIPYVPGQPQYGVTNVFDRRGRLVRSVEAQGRDELSTQSSVAEDRYVTSFQYGFSGGNAHTIRQGPDENDPSSPRALHRDESWRTALGREIERARFSSANTRLDLVRQEWDRLGRVTTTSRFVDPATGFVPVNWDYRYDSLGRQLSLTEPGMATRFNEYDEDGNPVESWWQDGVTRHITRSRYDGFGRATERRLIKSVSGSEQLQSHDLFHYDQHSGQPSNQPAGDYRGRLSWMETVGVGSVFKSYDEWGRMAETAYRFIDNPQLVREEGIYSAGGRLTQLVLETQSTVDAIGYEYDTAGRTRRVEDLLSGSPYWEALYTEFDGFYRRVELGNGVMEDFVRAQSGRRELIEWSAETNSGTRRHVKQAFDASGRVTEELVSSAWGNETRYYSFDSLGRLTDATLFQFLGYYEHYDYDALGNLRLKDTNTWMGDMGGDRVYEPDSADPDRLCRYGVPGTSGPCTFAYDGIGNVTVDASYGPMYERHIEYDAASRMIAIQRSSHGAIFTYGPTGRVRTQIDGTTDRDHWSFGLVEEQRVGSDVIVERRIPGPQGNVARRRKSGTSETTVYTHGEGRANYFFTDQQGAIVQSAYYYPFGQTSSYGSGSTMTTTDDLWNGGDNIPELGIVLLGPRAYDPEMGRFLQRDPIAITTRSSDANPYAFSFSDPVNFADPSGLTPYVCCVTRTYNGQPSNPVDPRAVLFGMGITIGISLVESDLSGGGGPARASGVDAFVSAFANPSGTMMVGAMWSMHGKCTGWCSVDRAIGGQRHRIAGAARFAGGYMMAQAGAGLMLLPGGEGVGATMFVLGVDQAAAGATSMVTNSPQRAGVNIVATEVSGSQSFGNVFEGGAVGAAGGAAYGSYGVGLGYWSGTGGAAESAAASQSVGASSAVRAKAGVPGDDFVPHPGAGKYVRPAGAGPTAAQRASVQGKPCVDCGTITGRQIADHIDPLVVEHWRTGTNDIVRQSSIEAVQAHCPACSPVQGGQLSAFSRRMRIMLGFE